VRVLLSAYACAPGSGSEEYFGHNWVKQVSRFHDVVVLTDGRNREAIRRYPYGEHVRFEFIDCLSSSARVGRDYRDWRGREWFAYFRFQIKSYWRGRRLLESGGFALSHLVTWQNYRWPFFVAMLPRPSIFGPVGGGEEYPRQFDRSWYESSRAVSIWLTRYEPALRHTLRRTSAILVASSDTARAIPKPFQPKVRLMRQGAEVRTITPPLSRPRRERLEIVWVGLLIPRKAADLLVDALAMARREMGARVRVVVYGDGPERGQLESRAARSGVSDLIEWRGWAPRAEVLRAYGDADVFCFTSLRETAPVAVLEAMASGLPVVCLAHAGQGEMVTTECGIRVAPTTRNEVVQGFAAGIVTLAKDAELRATLGRAARRRAELVYDWDSCGEEMARLYDEVVPGRGRVDV
jgi:glycosyltransferase involved in cell wall biosynthesis